MGITITAMTDALTTVVKNLDFESLTKTHFENGSRPIFLKFGHNWAKGPSFDA